MTIVETPLDVTGPAETSVTARRQWRIVGMVVAAPVGYAALYNLSFRTDENPFDGPEALMAWGLVALKFLSVAALVFGVHQVGTRIAASRSITWLAAAIWGTVGTVLVAVVALLKNRGSSLGIDQLWPGQTDPEMLGHLDSPPGPGWNATNIVTAEIVATVMLSVGVAILLRLVGRNHWHRPATVLTLVGFVCGLLVYDQMVGWPVMFDFDPFVGDAVLGVLTYELLVFVMPFDPLGAIGLAAIACANGLILVLSRRSSTRR